MANLIKKFKSNFDDITEYYNFLVSKTKKHEYVDITNEWLIDNYYLLVEHKNNIENNKKEIKKDLKAIEKNYFFIKNIVHKKNYNISFKYLVDELKKHQKETDEIFTYKELKHIITLLVFVYAERLNLLCREEYNKLGDKEDVQYIIDNKSDITLKSFIPDNFDLANNTHYVFEINNNISKMHNSSEMFKSLNEYLKENQVSIKEIMNDEFQRKIDCNLIMSNIFTDLKEFFEISVEDIYEKVSETEKLLLTDNVYKKMTIESKFSYRKQLLKLAKKNHMSEYAYLNKIMDKNEHIGFKLFKNKDTKPKVILYLSVILLLTGIISFFLCQFFIKPRIIGFLVIFIPISQLIVQIVNEILIRNVKTTVIPKLDYSKGIPEESKTMVVIPTIVANTAKIKEMFDILESFYLVNKTDNLYFTLLGDVKAGQEKVMPFDEEVSKYGREYAEKLNAKYKKDIFYFIYRKRLWNEKENCYLGYERKRGALIQFNKILLGEKIDENKFFNVNMLKDKKLDIKYVITLDTDTKLVLNSALNLVGAMAHPMNKPIFNKEKTKLD